MVYLMFREPREAWTKTKYAEATAHQLSYDAAKQLYLRVRVNHPSVTIFTH